MKYINNNKKIIIICIFIFIIFNIPLPYYIDAPGGISSANDKIEMNSYNTKGSFNIVYVKELQANIPTLIYSLLNKNYDIISKNDINLDNESYEDYITRDKLLMEESNNNAIYVAYNKANKKIDIVKNEVYVAYIDSDSKTDLKIGDKILSINGININSKEDISNIIKDFDIGDKVKIKVLNNKKEYIRYAYIRKEDNRNILGIVIVNINKYNTNPKIEINSEKSESGSSGGLMMALAIYNSLIEEDITHGLKIVGTGTIDIDGNVGEIAGIKYKLYSAVKNKADLFLVPSDNYEEAVTEKKKNNYKIKIIKINTFEEAIIYLNNIKK